MWEITISFEDDKETVRMTGDESDVPLWIALKYYNLFVKEAGGDAVYQRYPTDSYPQIPLETKIEQLSRL